MRDSSANQGGKPSSASLDNAPSVSELAVLAVFGDHLMKSTDFISLGHAGS